MSVIIIINNYFHDVATAFLAAVAILMLLVDKKMGSQKDPQIIKLYVDLYRKFTRVARFALVWIIIGGIPRIIFYKQIEWDMAMGKGIIVALIIKHILMFTTVLIGLLFWRRLSIKISLLKNYKNI